MAGLFRVQDVLQERVQLERAERPLAHGREYLQFRLLVDIHLVADALVQEVAENQFGLVGSLEGDKVEVRSLDRRREYTPVDFGGPVGDIVVARLPEYVLQPRRGNLGTADKVVQHVARTHARQLVGVPDQDDARTRGDGLEKRSRKPGVDHAELVDDKHVAVELVFGVVVELFCDGIHFEHAVDGARGDAAEVAHALCRAARGGGEEYAFVHLLRKVEDSLENGRLAGAGASRDDGYAVGKCHLDGLALDGVEGELVLAFPFGEVPLESGCREGVARQAVKDAVGDVLFRTEKRRVKAVVVYAADTVLAAQAFEFLQKGVDPVVVIGHQPQQTDCLFEQQVPGQKDVALVKAGFLEHIQERGLEPHRAFLGESDLHRNLVGLCKADSPDFFAEHVGVVADGGNRVGAVLRPELLGDAAGDAVLVEEQQCFPAVAVQLPCGEEGFDFLGGKPLDFCLAENVRMVVEDVGGVFAKNFHYGCGSLGADSLEQAGGQVFRDVLVPRRGDGERRAFELPAVLGMDSPVAVHLELFARP